jgi:AbrB family looped-hinge helix DNA binding protein
MAMTSVRVQAKGQITIPKKILEKLNVQPGDLVVFVETDTGVMVKPAAVMTDEGLREEDTAVLRSIQERFADYFAEEIDNLIAEAIREAREK